MAVAVVRESAVDRAYERKLSALRKWLERAPGIGRAAPASFEGVALRNFIKNCRVRRRVLPTWVRRSLDSMPGWSWNALAARDAEKLRVLGEYVAARGWTFPRDRRIVFSGVNLSAYLSACQRRRSRGILPQAVAMELARLRGTAMVPREAAQEQTLERVAGVFAARLRQDPSAAPADELAMLAQWLNRMRQAPRAVPLDVRAELFAMGVWPFPRH